MHRIALVLTTALAAGLAFAGAEHDHSAAKASPNAGLERLKQLAGTWTGTAAFGNPPPAEGQPATVVWKVTAAGTVATETIDPGGQHEMITVFHADGPDLMLTHYCAGGNQPRMKAKPSKDANAIVFDFDGGTNMKPGDEHMHALTIRLLDADHIESTWTSWSGGKPSSQAKFVLARKS
jgi:hypothetical protein